MRELSSSSAPRPARGQSDAHPGGGPEPADNASPFERFLRLAKVSSRRRTIAGLTLAALFLASIPIALAWRQYDDATSRALTELDARVVAVSALVNTSFAGQIATLEAIAKAPVVVEQDRPRMSRYFGRLESPAAGKLFSGGLGWIDRGGMLSASSSPGRARSLASRGYFRDVVATGTPFVSAGLVGVRTRQRLVAIAVPTRDLRGRLSGVLVGSILLKTVAESKQALELGYGGLQIVDRKGQLLLSGLTHVANTSLLARIERRGSGVVPATPGLDGRGDDAIAFARAPIAGWIVVLDRSRSSLFAPAERALLLELASVVASVVLVLGILAFVIRRARRVSEARDARAASWSALTRSLAAAATPDEVAGALIDALIAVFDDAVAVAAFESNDRSRVRAASASAYGQRLMGQAAALDAASEFALRGPGSWLLASEPTLRDVLALAGRRLAALHGLPILDRSGEPIGSIAVLSPAVALAASEWALLSSFADQAAQAFQRASVFEHDHELALRLQRSLLPDRLPSNEGVDLAGHYQAGGQAVEVGGDWYAAVARPDGLIQLCVGDVSGRGIGAATVMGRQRNTFEAYAHECASPAEIVRRMLRHAHSDEMITLACVSLDPFTGELVYACAGHPPPLVLDRDAGSVVRLDAASAPPVGVAEPADIIEARVQLPEHALLAMYTDGLIERRGRNIDEGIDLLGRVLAAGPNVVPDGVLAGISDEIGAPDDDVALLVLTLDAERVRFELELQALPESLPSLRRRLRAWLARRLVDPEGIADTVLAVSEACNNAIEHAYRGAGGSLRVSVSTDAALIEALVADQGHWREEVPNDERGRGILLMKRLMLTAEIETDAEGTRVRLSRRIGSGSAPALASLAPPG